MGSYWHVRTRKEFVFVEHLDFGQSLNDMIDSYNFEKMPWFESGYNLGFRWHNGFYKIVDLLKEPPQDCPLRTNPATWLPIIQQLGINEWRKFDPSLKVKETIRIHLNKMKQDGKMFTPDPHVDLTTPFEDEWAMVIHLRGSSGDTVFHTDLVHGNTLFSLPFQVGTVIIFPCQYPHNGHMPFENDPNTRYTLNFNFKIESDLNAQVKKYMV